MQQNLLESCSNALLRHICSNLKQLEVLRHGGEDLRRAAVAVAIVDLAFGAGVYGLPVTEHRSSEPALVLTRRASRLRKHAGQWAFPGGRCDQGESTEDAALRELSEEVGLTLNSDSIVGRLDDFTTRSGFIISPVVVWAGPGVELFPNPAEVASIHRIPIAELMRKDAPILHETSAGENPILMMPVGDSWIAAPTAAILYQFREVAILGNDVRVAHYDQPFFAWS